MKALLLAATSSLALTGFAMAQTATDSGTSGAAATPPAAGSTATDSSAAGTMGAGSSSDAAGVATGGADSAGMTPTGSDASTGTTTGTATDTGSGATMGATGAATGTGMDASGTTAGTTGGTATDTATTMTETTTVTTTADAGGAAMSADHPGMLGSWIMNRRIWTTNQPSSTEWAGTTLTERPAEWTDIAKVDDIVVDAEGNITGYVADIGGFLGLGAKQVLLDPDALHFVQIGDDAFFATNFTREELEALPDFDTTTVMR